MIPIPLLYLLICIVLLCLLLFFPGIAHTGTDLGVELFMEALFPYLLPYLILTQWFIRLTPDKNSSTPSRFQLYFKTYGISALGGFPTGAATISYLKKSKQLSLREANILLSICHSPSPLFVLGFVGNDLLNDTSYSWRFLILYHSLSIVILTLFYFYFRNKPQLETSISSLKSKETNPFTNSIKDSIPTVLIVGATIIFFATIYTVVMHSVKSFIPDIHNNVMLLLAAMLEMTNGLKIGQELFPNDPILLPLILTTFLSSQSFSIHMQVAVLAKVENLSLKPYLIMRLVYTLLMPLLFYLIFL